MEIRIQLLLSKCSTDLDKKDIEALSTTITTEMKTFNIKLSTLAQTVFRNATEVLIFLNSPKTECHLALVQVPSLVVFKEVPSL